MRSKPHSFVVLAGWFLLVFGTFTISSCGGMVHGQTPAAGPPKLVELSPVKERALPALPDDSPTIDVGKYRVFGVEGYTGPITWEVEGDSVGFKEVSKPLTVMGTFQGQDDPTEKDVPVGGVVIWGKKQGITKVVAYGVVDNKAKKLLSRMFQVGIPPPVDPINPDDKKPKPKPVVTSFRVILAYESGQTMTAAQTNVLYGGEVENWLTANCTGGKAGWRRRDKNAGGEADPTMAKLWEAIQKSVTDNNTATPFVAVEVNGAVEIIPFEANPAATVAKLKTYRGQ